MSEKKKRRNVQSGNSAYLTDAEEECLARSIPRWRLHRDGRHALRCGFRFGSSFSALSFVIDVTRLSTGADYQPHIKLAGRSTEVELSDRENGRLTRHDFMLAGRISEIWNRRHAGPGPSAARDG